MDCAKATFNTPEKALARLSEVGQTKNHDSRNKPIRYYKCQFCGKYHLTSTVENEKLLEREAENPPENIQELYEKRLKQLKLK